MGVDVRIVQPERGPKVARRRLSRAPAKINFAEEVVSEGVRPIVNRGAELFFCLARASVT